MRSDATLRLTPTGASLTRRSSDHPDFCAAQDFLTEEAWLLDDIDLDGWYALLHPDLVYDVPVRVTVGRGDPGGYGVDAGHYQDDYRSIGVRVRRLSGSRSAWAEDPPSRTRRVVSNLLCRASADGALHLRSALLLTRSRMDRHVPEFITAERRDILRPRDGRYLLAQRSVLLDQTVLGTANLAIFL